MLVVVHIVLYAVVVQADSALTPEPLNVHRMLTVGTMLAAKLMDDRYFNNAYYAKVSFVPVSRRTFSRKHMQQKIVTEKSISPGQSDCGQSRSQIVHVFQQERHTAGPHVLASSLNLSHGADPGMYFPAADWRRGSDGVECAGAANDGAFAVQPARQRRGGVSNPCPPHSW